MRFILLLLAAVSVGCKTIEGGYEANKDKQEAKQEKMMNEGE